MEYRMRLLVLALTALAFAQPALAHEHYHHHRHWARGVDSSEHLVRASARRHAWRTVASHRRERVAHVSMVDRGRQFAPRPSQEYRPSQEFQSVESGGAWGRPAPERARSFAQAGHGRLDAMISRHAQEDGVPEGLVHRVVTRESRYNQGVVGAGGAMGLMQIKLATAREMGYTGTAAGLLDPETNLTYAVRYLAGAYRVAGGNADRAVANYARGYRGTAVRQGAAPQARVASGETTGWSGSYASAGPVEPVAWVHAPMRHYQHRRLMRWQ